MGREPTQAESALWEALAHELYGTPFAGTDQFTVPAPPKVEEKPAPVVEEPPKFDLEQECKRIAGLVSKLKLEIQAALSEERGW